MSIRRFTCFVVLPILAVVALVHYSRGRADDPKMIAIEGVVLDSGNKPLEGVQIEVWRGGRPYSATTNADGYYKREVPAGLRIDQIRYSRSYLDVGVLVGLAGTGRQWIAIILYKRGQPRSTLAIANTLNAYEHVAFTAIDATKSDLHKTMVTEIRERKYAAHLADVPIPKDSDSNPREAVRMLRDRKERLIQLYRQQEW